MDRIDCGFFVIVSERDLEGMRAIRAYYDQVYRVTDAIREASDREEARRFRAQFRHQRLALETAGCVPEDDVSIVTRE